MEVLVREKRLALDLTTWKGIIASQNLKHGRRCIILYIKETLFYTKSNMPSLKFVTKVLQVPGVFLFPPTKS